jgi:cysteinyl-tRNA synthetase
VVFGVVTAANQRQTTGADAAAVRGFLERMDEIFAVLERDRGPRSGTLSNVELQAMASALPEGATPGEGNDADTVRLMLALRFRARRQRDFARADELRKLLTARGVELEDQRDGVRWRYL